MKTQIDRYLKKWKPRFKLENWIIEYEIGKDYEWDAYAESKTLTQIRWAYIAFNQKSCGENKNRDIERVVIHELLHIRFQLLQTFYFVLLQIIIIF